MGDKAKEQSEHGNGAKWWEFYLVRYALGTVFGLLIVNVLAKSNLAIPFPSGSIAEITKPEGLPLLLGYGLAYCYLASAPILVLHAARFSMRPRSNLPRTLAITVCSVAVSVAWSLFALRDVRSATLYTLAAIAIMIVGLILSVQLIAVHACFSQAGKMWDFYRKLDKNRRVPQNRELIDSYRHLREHGNAFFVVFLELALGLCLYVAGKVSLFPPAVLAKCSTTDAGCGGVVDAAVLQTVFVVLIWIAPAITVWAIGCFLEAEFANDATIGKP